MGEMTHKAFGSSRILGGKLGRSRLLEACVPNELHRLWSVVDTSLEDAPMRTCVSAKVILTHSPK